MRRGLGEKGDMANAWLAILSCVLLISNENDIFISISIFYLYLHLLRGWGGVGCVCMGGGQDLNS